MTTHKARAFFPILWAVRDNGVQYNHGLQVLNDLIVWSQVCQTNESMGGNFPGQGRRNENRNSHCKGHSKQWTCGIRWSFLEISLGEKFMSFIYTQLHQENNQLKVSSSLSTAAILGFWKSCPLGITAYYLKLAPQFLYLTCILVYIRTSARSNVNFIFTD